MTDRVSPSVSAGIMAALRELIDALDRRVPRIERTGEIRIAREAATLRSDAQKRLAELEHAASDQTRHDEELEEAVMTDDGSPLSRTHRR